MLGHDRFEGQRHHGADLGRIGHHILREMRVPLLRHGGAPDGAGADRFLDLAEFLLHLGVDLMPDLPAGSGQHGQQHDLLGQMVHDATGRHRHGRHVEMGRHASLYLESLLAEGGDGPGGPAEQCLENSRFRLMQTLDMARELVDPDRDLQPIGRRHRVLAVGASRQGHVLGAFGEIGHRLQDRRNLTQEDPVRLSQQQQVARLGDVLRGRAPMNIVPGIPVTDLGELPDQRHQRMRGAAKAFHQTIAVDQGQVAFSGDFLGRFGRDHAEFGLGLG